MSAPEPGIWRNIPFNEYRSWKAVNSGLLRWGTWGNGDYTSKHLLAASRGEMEIEDSQALKFGRAAHVWILEGEEAFHQMVKVSGTCEAIQKNGKRCGNGGKFITADNLWYCGKHKPELAEEPVDVIDAGEFQAIQRMQASLKRHPINFHLAREGFSEISAVWDADGLRCKCRMDRMAPPQKGMPHLVIDLKKMRVGHGSRYKCEKEIENRGYHIQARMNCEAVEVLESVDEVEFAWVFVEDGPPYDVQFIVADAETMMIAEREVSALRRQYRLVTDTPHNAYGYSDSPLHIAGEGDSGEDINRGGLSARYRKEFHMRGM